MDPLKPVDGLKFQPPATAPARRHDDALPADRAEFARGEDLLEVSRELARRAMAPRTAETPAESGPLSLIISAPDNGEREALKKLFLDRDPRTRITVDLPLINAFAVELAPDAVGVLPSLGKVAQGVRVYLDNQMSIPEGEQEQDVRPALDTAAGTLDLQQLWDRGLSGKDVAVAVIDTGVAPHSDLGSRIIGFKDFVNGRTEPYDDQGHGTHVAGTVAGDGKASEGRYKGAAPQASVVGIKVLDGRGSGSFSDVIAGIQWAVDNKDKYGIKVINMSLGGRARQSYKDDPVAQAIEAAAAAGIVPCVAAGNSGPGAKTINTPAHALNALTVAASDDRGTVGRDDDRIASFSSRGPSPVDLLDKPDVSAPGVDITAADWRGGYRTLSGTSMATPMVAGVAALLLEARPDLTPAQVKGILMQTADPIAATNATAQGAGVIDPLEALDAPAPAPPTPPAPPEPAPPSEPPPTQPPPT